MQQNSIFNEEPLSPSFVTLNRSQKNSYSNYRIPYFLTDEKDQHAQISMAKSAIKADRYISNSKPRKQKNVERIKSQAFSRNDGSRLPIIKIKEFRLKNSHRIRSVKSSSLSINNQTQDKYSDKKNPQNKRSASYKPIQPKTVDINDFFKRLKKKKRRYQQEKFLMSEPRNPFFLRNVERIYTSGQTKEKYPSYIKFADLKTKYQKDRKTMHFIYHSFRRQNTLKGKLQLRIPKIPRKQELKDFIDCYIPNNHEIHLGQLLKANFCVIQYTPKNLYIGEMIGRHKNGLGIQITQLTCFQGEWKNNHKVKGLEITPRGVYKGTYLNNLRSGNGQFQRHTGELYVGEWLKGKEHGNGLWINTQGQSYRGQWRFGKPHGHGVLALKQRNYNGYFIDFRQEGFGREVFVNGDSYQGIFRDDLPQGEGVYKWKNGSRFVGSFVRGMRQGNGELYFKDMMIYRGPFMADKPQGQCQIIFSNGKKYDGKVRHSQNITLLKSPLF